MAKDLAEVAAQLMKTAGAPAENEAHRVTRLEEEFGILIEMEQLADKERARVQVLHKSKAEAALGAN